MNPQERKAIPLTESDQKNSVSKYYTEQTVQPSGAVMGALMGHGPLDASAGIQPAEAGEKLAASEDTGTGYTLLENGAGYASVETLMPGVTMDMIKWWFSWFPLEQIRYKIWEPYSHMTIAVSDQHEAYLKDASVSVEDKSKNVIHFAVNVTPVGEQNVISHYEDVHAFGIDNSKLEDAFAIGGFRIMAPRLPKHGHYNKSCSTFLYYFKENAEGVCVTAKEWLGYRINKGIPMYVLPADVKLPVEAPMGTALGMAAEWANLATILPELYREYGK